ncbi:early nodulin-like protein 20 [Mercurialis annua]|uniref:early nodulin-like protein 20 n=1 Tax=Mercurialis annua TaxID=3986 RepID=UPI002160180E|nr:early nodulin-like protein 20 [Mercurialis annua]
MERNMLLWVVMLMLLNNADCGKPVLHKVGGGKYTWRPNTNFTEWATHQQFYVGDWLYFGFNKSVYNVLEVNKTSYDKCVDKDFITNITRGGRDVFNLTNAKPYYFLSGRGYCAKGMKLAVNVQFAPPDPVPLPSLRNGASNTHPIFLLYGATLLYLYSLYHSW